jgi:hypothetical protein
VRGRRSARLRPLQMLAATLGSDRLEAFVGETLSACEGSSRLECFRPWPGATRPQCATSKSGWVTSSPTPCCSTWGDLPSMPLPYQQPDSSSASHGQRARATKVSRWKRQRYILGRSRSTELVSARETRLLDRGDYTRRWTFTRGTVSTEEEEVVADTQGRSGTPSSTPTLYGGGRQRGSVTLKQLDASHRLDQAVLRDELVNLGCIIETFNPTR